MKKTFLFVTLFTILLFAKSQGIDKDYVDEFTKKHVVETEDVSVYNRFGTLKCSFKAVGNEVAMIIRFMTSPGNVFSIDEGRTIAVLMSDNSVVWFYNPQYTISTLGGGATGFVGSQAPGLKVFAASDSILKLADENLQIDKFRLYTSKGILDFDVKSDKSMDIKLNFLLILNTMDTPRLFHQNNNVESSSETMTSEQALDELSKWKRKLDLQIITQEVYDKKKEELMKYID